MPLIKDEKVKVTTADRNEDGKQIDAEEKEGEIIQEVPVNLTGSSGANFGELAQGSTTNRVGTVGDIATGMAHQCYLCGNFDQVAFRKWKSERELNPDLRMRAELDHLRSFFLEGPLYKDNAGNTAPDGDIDVEGAMMSECGICRVITEIKKDPIVVLKNSGCPTEDPQFGNLTHCFRPVSGEARTVADDVRDTILKTAQGKVKRKGFRVPMHVFKPKG